MKGTARGNQDLASCQSDRFAFRETFVKINLCNTLCSIGENVCL